MGPSSVSRIFYLRHNKYVSCIGEGWMDSINRHTRLLCDVQEIVIIGLQELSERDPLKFITNSSSDGLGESSRVITVLVIRLSNSYLHKRNAN